MECFIDHCSMSLNFQLSASALKCVFTEEIHHNVGCFNMVTSELNIKA